MAIGDGWTVSFFSARRGSWFDVQEDLQLTPVERPPGASVVWVVRPEAAAVVMPALSRLRPSPRVVYDSMDLHHLRLGRESRVTGSRGLALQARLMRRLERQACSRADVAVAISDREALLLRELAGGAEIAVLPNVHEPRADGAPPLADRSGLLFVGNFSHTPNLDAVQVLARDVMPRVWRRQPELVLSVAGRGLEPGEFDPRIRVLGFVDDLDALIDRSAALVAPLRFGAGLKGKIGYALARGLPVVTTEIGAEGFAEPAGIVAVRDDDWDAFGERTLELLASPDLWARASAQGIELTRREYSPAALSQRLQTVLEPSAVPAEPLPAPRPQPSDRSGSRRFGTAQARVAATALLVVTLLILVFAALPEALGDRPYNAFGH